MEIRSAHHSDIEVFVKIYNSAILLFPENQRSNATPIVFRGQFKYQENFLCLEEAEPTGFSSYKMIEPGLAELGSLYVSKEYQNMGYGKYLLAHVEQQLPAGTLLYAKVLNNAPWSIEFYKKNGFVFATENDLSRLKTTQNGWELVMWKRV